nr:hypothetical protein [Legionella jordanis]
MNQENNELFPLESLSADPLMLVATYLNNSDEPQEIKSNRTKYFPFFRSGLLQENRILAKLAQYAAEANVTRVASLVKIRPDLRIEVLFTLAGLAAQDEMEAMLKEHPEDLLVKAPLRDISGRVFEPLSVFQHAIWAKDVRYMAQMMLDCMPKNAKGEQIRLKLEEQYEQIVNKGVAYTLKGIRYVNERYFSLQPLITALSDYKKNYLNMNSDERHSYWCTVIGTAQSLLPAHIRHHYCDSENPFWDKPNIKAPHLKRSLEIHHLGKRELWAENLVELGKTLAIWVISSYDSTPAYAVSGKGYGVIGPHLPEIEALCSLDEHRTNVDLPALVKRLKTPIVDFNPYARFDCP